MISNIVKILVSSAFSFCIGLLITPVLTKYLYQAKMWKKSSVKKSLDGREATITKLLHNDEERKTPRMGGVVVWGSVLVTLLGAALLSLFFPSTVTEKISFLSRNQTLLPFGVLIVTAIIGLLDDYLVCCDRGSHVGGGLSLSKRLIVIFAVAALCAWWFYIKLDMSSIIVPFVGMIPLGIFFIPLFIFFMVGMYSGGIIDGIDGLAGGIFTVMYSSYALIAFYNNQVDLATFCMVIVGGLLAFLWFNIPPARFFLSETGTMALTTTLVVVAFLTGEVGVLPIIALPLVVTSASVVIQLVSKQFRNGKKVFLVSPLHNHFQALGWPAYKVTMRYWIISVFCAVLGIILAFI